MVRGIGVDIIEIDRIARNVKQFGETFLSKIFTSREISYCQSKVNSAQHFAARFAAKEALSKAISTGWDGEFSWKDVEVSNDATGQPHLVFHHELRERLARCTTLVTLSHSHSHVVAMVLIEDRIP